MTKFKKKVAISAMVAFCALTALPASAGGAATGGASEVTQIINSIQLIFSGLTEYETLAAETSQYSTQLTQYKTQLQNLQKAGDKAYEVMGGAQALADAEKAYNKITDLSKATTNIYSSSKSLGERMDRFNQTGVQLDMTPTEMKMMMSSATGGRRDYFQKQLNDANAEAARVEADAAAFDKAQKAVGDADGNLKSLAAVASTNLIVGKIASETRQDINNLVKMQAVQGAAAEEEKLMSAESLGLIRQRQRGAFAPVK